MVFDADTTPTARLQALLFLMAHDEGFEDELEKALAVLDGASVEGLEVGGGDGSGNGISTGGALAGTGRGNSGSHSLGGARTKGKKREGDESLSDAQILERRRRSARQLLLLTEFVEEHLSVAQADKVEWLVSCCWQVPHYGE